MMRAFSRPRQQHSSTVISTPMGPVKSSRGIDLVRSDTLTIVASINSETNEGYTRPLDHSSSSLKSQLPVPKAVAIASPKSVQSIASGLEGSSLASKPTVARSNITAMTTTLQSRSHNQSKPLRPSSLKPSISVPLLELTHSPKSASLSLTTLTTAVQDENTPPTNEATYEATIASRKEDSLPVSSNKISKLPKSRTMGVLNELKASIQRPGTVSSRARRASNLPMPLLESVPSTDSGKTAIPTSATPSRVWLSHSSLTSLVRSSRSCTPELIRPDQVVAAQPSAYWSGRFLALHDRFLSEAQEEMTAPVRQTTSRVPSQSAASLLRDRTGGNQASRGDALNNSSSQFPFSTKTTLPHANTTSSLSKIMFKPSPINISNEDDDRCRRIFTRLEESCLTTEAKQSLQDWQHAYARKLNRPTLLPLGRAMDEKSRVARFFSGSSMGKKRQPQRQSLPGVPSLGKKARVEAVVDVTRKKSLIVL